eukprot:TRINITY_DN7353_c0_g4_i1.p1 TRINITY_DN7353_c0_g4~~TRINITY_DN7353_c0_g4_i1.p1  ORF type:complete len:798 (+),score=170.08 TRINITY_DN7353_c0_g4_i1:2263-4656(+)
MTGNEVFLGCVSADFLKIFVNTTVYSNFPNLKQNGTFAIHEWGKEHIYVNRAVSEFRNAWEELKKSKVKVPASYLDPMALSKKHSSAKKIPHKKSPAKDASYVDQSKDLVVSICKTMSKWAGDKSLYEELKAEIGQRRKRLGEMGLGGNKEAGEVEKVMKSLPGIMARIMGNDMKAKLSLIEISKGFTSPKKEASGKKGSLYESAKNAGKREESVDHNHGYESISSLASLDDAEEVTQTDIRRLNRKVDQLISEKAELKRQYAKAEEDNKELARRYDDVSKEFRQESADSQKSVMDLKKALTSKKAEFSKKDAGDSDLAQQELELNKKHRKQLHEALRSVENELAGVKEENSLLASALENLSRQERDIKSKIEAIKKSPIKSAPMTTVTFETRPQLDTPPVSAPPMYQEEIIKSTPLVQATPQPIYQPPIESAPTVQPTVKQLPEGLAGSSVPQAKSSPQYATHHMPAHAPVQTPPQFAPAVQNPLAQNPALAPNPPVQNLPSAQNSPQVQPVQSAPPQFVQNPPQAPPATPSVASPAPQVASSPAKPLAPLSPGEARYKNCLTSLSGTWHEDDTILVTISRSVNVPMKSAVFKITIENKLTDNTLHIKGLELVAYDEKALRITINNIPKWIEPKDKKTGDMRISLQGFITQYTFCKLNYEVCEGEEWNARLKVPINTVMFCTPLEGGPEEYQAKLMPIKDKVTGAMFELDQSRVNSLKKIRELLSFGGAVKVYPPIPQSKGSVFAAAKFGDEVGLLQINVSMEDPSKCLMMVCSVNDAFKNVIAAAVLDVLSRPKA